MQTTEHERSEFARGGRGDSTVGLADVSGIHRRFHNRSVSRRAPDGSSRARGEASRRVRNAGRVGLALALALVAFAARPVRADLSPIEDAVEIQLVGRDLLAVISLGGPFRTRLEAGEQIVFSAARGRVGLVVTNRRLLGVSPGATGWIEAPRRIQERASGDPLLSSRIALVVSDQRVLAYDGDAGRWVESSVGPHEVVEEASIAQAVAVVATGRRGLALAAGTARFAEVPLHVGEHFEALSTLADVATLRTDRRVLVFKGQSASWGAETRPLE